MRTAAPGRGHASPLALVLTLVLLLSGTVACSALGDDEGATSDGSRSSARSLPTTTTVGEVTGKMSPERRQALKRSVARTVDRWWDAAYVGGKYPRPGGFHRAFPGFSAGAKDEARRDLRLMTNAGLSRRINTVLVRRRDIRLDVLAVRGRPAAVTARVHLVFATRGKVARRDRVRGRLHLTWRPGGWQVFGYEITRGRA